MISGLGGPAGYGENVFTSTPKVAGDDDNGAVEIDVTSVFGSTGIEYFGSSYSSLYLNSNGTISFGAPQLDSAPDLAGGTIPTIAAFWSDVDISQGGEIYWDIDPDTGTITLTWLNVAPNSGPGSNSFQLVLTATGDGTFTTEIIYEDIRWTDGGSGSAQSGFSDGNGTTLILDGSGDAQVLRHYERHDLGTGDPAGLFSLDFVNGAPAAADGVVEGSDAADVIDSTFTDADGDQVGTGDDSVVASAGNDWVETGDGADTVAGGSGRDTIHGQGGDDSLDGGDGRDTLLGGDGDDTLHGGAGGDALSGGAGFDFIDYSGSTSGVAIDLTGGTASGGDAQSDTLAGDLEGIIGSDWDDTLTGYDGAGQIGTNVLYGGAGSDLIDGAGGDDLLYGEDGSDTIIGGTGADLIDGGAGDDVIHAGSGDTVSGGAGDDVFILDAAALGGGTLTIDGGELDEPGGDTLDFSGLIDWDAITYSSTDPGALAGTTTLSDGTVVEFSNIEDVIICFTGGTHILSAQGARPVETLRPGDLVLTRDHGLQPIRWIGSRSVTGTRQFAPVRFAPGTLGNDRPLLVSPQHRMLHHSPIANLYFNDSEVLVPAKHMVNGSTIQQVDQLKVTYYHLLFDRHEIVFAEGVASESFHPGQTGLHALSDASREELFVLFPELRGNPNGFGDTARLCLKAREATVLMAA